MKKFLKEVLRTAILVALVGLFIFGSEIFAWTAPTVAPPGGNVIAPLNTGSVNQTKDGILALNGLNVNYGTLLNNSGAAPGNIGLTVKGKTILGSITGLETTDKTLDVIGSTKTTDAYVTSAANCAGSLNTDSNGKVICNTDPFSNDNFCNSDLTGPLAGMGSTGVKTISMLKNGRNICTDNNGCTYRFFSFVTFDITGIYKDSPIMFWQRPGGSSCSGLFCAIFEGITNAGKWYDAKGNTEGKNGNAEGESQDKIQSWGIGDKFVVYDDFNNYKGFTFSDSNPDTLVIMDNDSNDDYAFILCDF